MIYETKYFNIKELVPEVVWKDLGNRAWKLFDERALRALDQLREGFGKAIVNDWCFGGELQNRGFRLATSMIGGVYSQHRFGRAFDVTFEDVSANDVRGTILSAPDLFVGINAIEMDVDWLHFDTRVVAKRIFTFKP
jgi:hypothetical protein